LEELSSGLDPERETVCTTPPVQPFWSENMMFALYDPTTQVGLMLHLGSRPDDWSMWHDQAYVMLPPDRMPEEGGVAWMWAFHRTAPERRPAGANLAFRCIEPFARWRIEFDGYMLLTPNREMTTGLAREGLHHRVVVDLDVEMVTPAWDLAAAATRPTARGTWASQSWAEHHYQQLHRASGTVRVGTEEIPFLGYGWRDHSEGARGAAEPGTKAPWGGHCTAAAVFPASGRAWSFSRYHQPDGTISLDAGYVVVDGQLVPARVGQTPRLDRLQLDGEVLPTTMAWEGGALDVTMTTQRSLWMAMRLGQVVGLDLEGPGMMYVINHGSTEWDGEIGTFYVERSDMRNMFPEHLTCDGEVVQ
jgi:hypothetical protein